MLARQPRFARLAGKRSNELAARRGSSDLHVEEGLDCLREALRGCRRDRERDVGLSPLVDRVLQGAAPVCERVFGAGCAAQRGGNGVERPREEIVVVRRRGYRRVGNERLDGHSRSRSIVFSARRFPTSKIDASDSYAREAFITAIISVRMSTFVPRAARVPVNSTRASSSDSTTAKTGIVRS